MKSKTSFFNKTMFKKNMTLYWPLWGVYTLILLVMQPVMLWIHGYNGSHGSDYSVNEKLENLISCLNLEGYVLLLAVMAVIIGMALYNYMYNSKSANMIHSLPVDRTELFGTNVLSGLTMLIVPQILTAAVSVIVCLAYGIPNVHYIGIWLLMAMGTAFVAFAIVTFCAMFTGLLVVLPVFVLIVNFLSWWAYYIITTVVTTFGYGVESVGGTVRNIVGYLCPLDCFVSDIGLTYKFSAEHECIGINVYGEGILVIYILVAVLLYGVAYFIYKRRHIEQAGDFITVDAVKPIFRWGAGISGGIWGACIVYLFFGMLGIYIGVVGYVLCMLPLGAVCYFAADMFVHKNFHVFKKKNWIGCGAFSIVLLVCFLGMYGMSEVYEKYIPEAENVETVVVSMGYDMEFVDEDIETAIMLHEEILDNVDICERYEGTISYADYRYVWITYTLKDGSTQSRNYILPSDIEETGKIISKIRKMEENVETYLSSVFCRDYEKAVKVMGGRFEFVKKDNVNHYEDGGFDYTYDGIELSTEQSQKLYLAIIKDAKAGNLLKYNIDGQGANTHVDSNTQIYISFIDLNNRNYEAFTEEVLSSYYDPKETVEYESMNSAYLNLGPDCENIINTLLELELIESVDIIWWGE